MSGESNSCYTSQWRNNNVSLMFIQTNFYSYFQLLCFILSVDEIFTCSLFKFNLTTRWIMTNSITAYVVKQSVSLFWFWYFNTTWQITQSLLSMTCRNIPCSYIISITPIWLSNQIWNQKPTAFWFIIFFEVCRGWS